MLEMMRSNHGNIVIFYSVLYAVIRISSGVLPGSGTSFGLGLLG
jgi:hypothetical protein